MSVGTSDFHDGGDSDGVGWWGDSGLLFAAEAPICSEQTPLTCAIHLAASVRACVRASTCSCVHSCRVLPQQPCFINRRSDSAARLPELSGRRRRRRGAPKLQMSGTKHSLSPHRRRLFHARSAVHKHLGGVEVKPTL